MKNSKTFSNISWSIAEKILTDLISSVVSIVLARFLLPEDYGTISLIQIFITISSIFVSCGLGSSIIQNKDADEEQISTIFFINIALGLIIYFALFIGAPLVANYYNDNELIVLMRVLAIKVPISSVYSIQHSYIQKRLEFKKFFFSSLFGTLLAGVIGTIMAINGFGAWALVASTLIDQVIDCIILFITTGWIPTFKFSYSKSKKMIEYGKKILLSELLGRVYEQFRPLIIAFKYSKADLAFNSKGQKLSYAVVSLAGSSLTKVMFPTLSSVQNDDKKLLSIARNTSQVAFFLVSPLLIGMFSTANVFIPLLLTENWIGCVPYVQIYCLVYLFAPIIAIDNQLLNARGRSDLTLKSSTIEVTLEVIALIISIILFDRPLYLFIGVLLAQYIGFFVTFYYCKKEINYGFMKQFKQILPTLIIGLIMGIVVYFVGFINIGYLAKIIIQVIVGAIIYVALSLITKLEPAMYIINFFFKKKENTENE